MKPTAKLALLFTAAALSSGCASRQLVFTTYTKVGLHISGTSEIPNNLVFGYKRFEGAIIPVDPKKAKEGSPDIASVFASVNVTNKWLQGLHIRQTFATGKAAEEISAGGTQ